MSDDLIELGGWLLSCWALGYGLGLFIYWFRKLTDYV